VHQTFLLKLAENRSMWRESMRKKERTSQKPAAQRTTEEEEA